MGDTTKIPSQNPRGASAVGMRRQEAGFHGIRQGLPEYIYNPPEPLVLESITLPS
jgi:hypothetical protein